MLTRSDLTYAESNEYFHLHHLYTYRGGYYLEIQLKNPNPTSEKFVALGRAILPKEKEYWNTVITVRLLKPGQGYVGKDRELAIPTQYQRKFGPTLQRIGASLQADEFQTGKVIDYFLYCISPIMLRLVRLDFGPKLLPLPEPVEQLKSRQIILKVKRLLSFFTKHLFIHKIKRVDERETRIYCL